MHPCTSLFESLSPKQQRPQYPKCSTDKDLRGLLQADVHLPAEADEDEGRVAKCRIDTSKGPSEQTFPDQLRLPKIWYRVPISSFELIEASHPAALFFSNKVSLTSAALARLNKNFYPTSNLRRFQMEPQVPAPDRLLRQD